MYREKMTRNKSVARRHKHAKIFYDENSLRRGVKDPNFHRLRPRHQSLKISNLVYKFLGNVASVNADRRQRNNARTNFQRTHVRRYSRQCRRPDDPKTNDQIFLHSGQRIPKKTSLVSDLEKKSNVQFVEEYIKAVNESKRRAERYICKALAFGVDEGFLMPTDADGHVFRVSSGLDLKILKQDLDWSQETGANDNRNGKRCFVHRSKRRDLSSGDSTS